MARSKARRMVPSTPVLPPAATWPAAPGTSLARSPGMRALILVLLVAGATSAQAVSCPDDVAVHPRTAGKAVGLMLAASQDSEERARELAEQERRVSRHLLRVQQ